MSFDLFRYFYYEEVTTRIRTTEDPVDVIGVLIVLAILVLFLYWRWRAGKVQCAYCNRLGKKIAVHEEGGDEGPLLSYECPKCGPRMIEL